MIKVYSQFVKLNYPVWNSLIASFRILDNDLDVPTDLSLLLIINTIDYKNVFPRLNINSKWKLHVHIVDPSKYTNFNSRDIWPLATGVKQNLWKAMNDGNFPSFPEEKNHSILIKFFDDYNIVWRKGWGK